MRSWLKMVGAVLFAAGGISCQSQMYEAKAVDEQSGETDTAEDTGTGTGKDSDSDTDTGADSDTAGEDKPGPEDTWVNLTVNCDLEECSDGKNLKFYADLLEENLGDGADYYLDFGPVSFPFNTLLKKTANMMGKEYDWPNMTLVGGAYYDMDDQDLKVAAEVDLKTTGNVWNLEKGKINDIELTLQDTLMADDVWIDLTIECDEPVCQETGKSFHFALYDGDEQTGAPDYYVELKNITYPYHKIVRRMANVYGVPLYLPTGNVTGGGYHDTYPDDTTNGLPNETIDPTDLHNTYPLKKGELNYMKLQLNLLPKVQDVWIKLTVYCDDPLCDQDGELRFYAYDGAEEDGEPDYFNSFKGVTFPFHAMIKKSASYALPDTPKTFPNIATIIGGAFYDVDPKGSLFDGQDPQSRGNQLSLTAGEVNELVVRLTTN